MPGTGRRPGFGQATASGAIDFNQLTGVGDLGTAILAGIPEAFRGAVEPFIGNIVAGIHQAFSLAVAQTFWIGVAAAIIAAIAAAFMIELPSATDDRVPAPVASGRRRRRSIAAARRVRPSTDLAPPSRSTTPAVHHPGVVGRFAGSIAGMPMTPAPFRPRLQAAGTADAPFHPVLGRGRPARSAPCAG